MNEKRSFTRLPFDADAQIVLEDKVWNSEVVDLSLQGVLVKKPKNWPDSISEENILFRLILSEDVVIEMRTALAHKDAEHLGLSCKHLDINSIAHLRRLMELNLGNANLLDRELEKLWSESLEKS